ncbi:Uncharacterized protein SCF082_LOCUS47821 [Durusdinium trenchii]|uniref:Uncharacterized protein n=1 Tax=Durusdinium trenchii TaxID=1381693 RepID=A0ABP0RNW0_9DINO
MKPRADAVVKAIKEAQEAKTNGYKQALLEIRGGRKSSHWIWYVWPSLASVRKTTRPQYSLRDVRDAKALIRDPLLRERLKEITGVAERHLASGTKPEILFGSRVDVEKFHECATCFALVALKVRDLELAQVMIDALVALHGGALEPTTVKYLTEEGDLAEFAKVGLLSNQKGIKK